MRFIQFENASGRRVGLVRDTGVIDLTSANPAWVSVYEIAWQALEQGITLPSAIQAVLTRCADESPVEYGALLDGSAGRLLPPVDHPDQRRVLIAGTGLTHTGSMQSRDQMHADESAPTGEPQTDSARMFQMGLNGGTPESGARGVAPEWFYKGDGWNLRGSGDALEIPAFAEDGGEEPEIAGIYLVDAQGQPHRLGFCLGNEWSDHQTEKVNYLYLAPSKLRTCSIGPELVVGFDFAHVDLECSVTRGDDTLYHSGPLLSGEQNMCHSLANCEDHHFKYPQHRRPGDLHVHYFGTSQLSFSQRDWSFEDGDVITIRSPQFGAPLINSVRRIPKNRTPVRVQNWG